MKLFLIRHGEALPSSVDSDRPLSDRGVKQGETLAAILKEHHGFQRVKIYHSPKLRAEQTASIISKAFLSTPLLMSNELLSNSDPDIWHALLDSMEEDIVLVSHLPFIPALFELLAGENDDITFPTASCLLLESSENGWALIRQDMP